MNAHKTETVQVNVLTSHSRRYTARRGTWQMGHDTWRISARDGGVLSECVSLAQVKELFERLDPAPKQDADIDLRKVVEAHTNDIRRVGHPKQHILCRLMGHTPVYSTTQVYNNYTSGIPNQHTVFITSCEHFHCRRTRANG